MSEKPATTRTVRRISVELNKSKLDSLRQIAEVFANEKQIHLDYYQTGINFSFTRGRNGSRERRDELTSLEYKNIEGLSARGVNLAIKDGFETELKYWAAIAAQIRTRRVGWTQEQVHYANWLICTPQRFSALVLGRAPINEKITLTVAERRQVQNYLRRRSRGLMGNRPSVKIARSFVIDPGMYRVFEQNSRQYISITSLEKAKRVTIPLEGRGTMAGNLRIVLAGNRVEAHVTFKVKAGSPESDETAAVDVGITEVAVDEFGNRYGERLGEIIAKQSDRTADKNRKRNRLHALADKHERNGNKKKARNIRKYNLGRKKLLGQKRRARIEQTDEINRAIAKILRERQPAIVVAEKLDIRRKAPSKKMSRRAARWLRSTLAERIEFKASAAGCRREHVNPAYTSQTCPACGFVERKNRKADRFQCGHAGYADQIAAINQKTRLSDPEITLFMPKETVKAILCARFNARVESQSGKTVATVPGQTSTRSVPRRRTRKSETAAGNQAKPAAIK
jgi:putative transposase